MQSQVDNKQVDSGAGSNQSQGFLPCWSCRGPFQVGDLFCPTCEAMLPPGQRNHFDRLGLEVAYDIDMAALDRAYFDLQRRLHPDRFATRTPRERALSQQQATSINEAYETLKDSLKRADYLVHLKGVKVFTEGCNQINDPVILMEAMELREELAETDAPEDVDRIAKATQDDIEDCEIGMSLAFKGGDLEGACSLITRLKFLRKLADEVRAHRAKLGKA
ncbi:MAG: Fe-S protein assembly co-chaperone HscB [Rhodospirillales bacterium]|nr:Fe-S protein assembly co-chaperone HscB [Rhodospirillales bacterium]